jgi:hypothetical protein
MKIGSRGVSQNLFRKFWTFLQVSTNFEVCPIFWNLKQLKNYKKNRRTVTSLKPAHGLRRSARRPAMRGRPRRWPATHRNGARVVRAHSAVTSHSSHARQRGDTLYGGLLGAGRRHGVADEHRWGPGVVPGRRRGGGAHPSGGSM